LSYQSLIKNFPLRNIRSSRSFELIREYRFGDINSGNGGFQNIESLL